MSLMTILNIFFFSYAIFTIIKDWDELGPGWLALWGVVGVLNGLCVVNALETAS